MPPKEQKHERLGSLGSGSGNRPKAGGSQTSMASRFRPKNFAKPEIKVEEKQSTVQIKKEPLTTPDTATEIAQVSGGSTRKSKYSVTEGRMRREAVQDQVVFGGGIGAASTGPRRTSQQQQHMGGDSTERRPSASRNNNTKSVHAQSQETNTMMVDGTGKSKTKDLMDIDHPVLKKEEELDVMSSTSGSDHEEDDADALYKPTTLDYPPEMPRDVNDIDNEHHAEASERISHIFTEASIDDFMLFQLPEMLPILSNNTNSTAPHHGEESGCCSVGDLHNQVVGKLLITRSGKVKMKIGEIMFDVSKGVECRERQELVFIDKRQETGKLLNVGAVSTRVTVSPDTFDLLLHKQ